MVNNLNSNSSLLSRPSPLSGPSPFGRAASPLSNVSNLSLQNLSQNRQEVDLAGRSVQKVSLLGAKYIEDAVNGGALSVKSVETFFEQADALIKSRIGDIQKVADEARQRIETFMRKADEADTRFAEFAVQMMKIELSQENLERYQVLKQVNMDLKNAYSDTTRTYMTLQKELAGMDERWKGIIEVAFDERIKGIKILEAGLDVIHQAQNHEVEIFIKLHSQYLKEEAQIYDQIMQAEVFNSEERDKEHARHIKENELDIKRDKLKFKRREAEDRVALEAKKNAYDQAYRMAQMEFNAGIEKEKIRVNERIEMAKQASQLPQPSPKPKPSPGPNLPLPLPIPPLPIPSPGCLLM
ncbi:hypothetical protein [Neochlamydia sp. S13]|uniref:hypothetical protein n=1 Tax=Neochlamydia sp. S13 TaxID=1353976 RepID=UPI0005A9A771|nr:hypothetical protein [Neochlamydia sp. S13]BBI17598.1 hypothetical protein NCS13_1_1403 [Neochlamydia sp. S13]